MRNLISGGAGFIGTNLTKKLINIGEEVICLDNFLTSNKNNISEFLNNPNFKLIEQDIIKPLDIKIDRIWHLACPASPHHYLKDPIKTSKIIFLGTHNLLELARRQNASFLFASSSEIYGESTIYPQAEDDNGSICSIGKRSCYREGKRLAESLCFDFHRTFLTDIRIARIFNTYGPNMLKNDGRVISNFIQQAINNKPITLNGSGFQTRSFCFVDDLVEGLIKLMNSTYNKPINIGNDEEISIFNLANIIKDKINPKNLVINIPVKEEDLMRRKPNIKLAMNLLDWEPKVNLEDGLNITIDYFKRIKEH